MPEQPSLDAAIAQIEEWMRRGALDAAESSCRQVLQHSPEDSRAWNCLGLITLVRGAFDQAEAALKRAAALAPGNADAWNNLSAALFQQGKLDEAAECARSAIAHGNATAAPWLNLGHIAVRQQQWGEASTAYRQALSLDPQQAAAWCNLAVAEQEQGRFDSAEAAFQRSLSLAPDDTTTRTQYAWLLAQRGQPERAIEAIRDLLLPVAGSAHAWVVAGHAYGSLGSRPSAIAAYRQALELAPERSDAASGLAAALANEWKLTEAEALIDRTLANDPSFVPGWGVAGGIQQTQGDAEQAVQYFRHALELKPDAQTHSNLLLAMQYLAGAAPDSFLAAHRAWDAAYARALFPVAPAAVIRRGGGRPLRIGLVSANFRRHPIAFLALPGLEQLDRKQCELVCYADRADEDEYTARFRAAAADWRPTAGLSPAELAEQVRRDEIDVLVDLMGHTGTRLLAFARKPAPLQMTWLGYVGTTGLAAMDCLLADRFHVCPGEESGYVEQVLRMPHSYACFGPPADAPAVGPLPARASGQVTFGSFNNPAKLSSLTIDTWSDILRQIPGSQLLLKFGGLDEPELQHRWRSRFGRRGIAPQRILLEGWSDPNALLATYGRVDLSLDTLPYSGGLTTCESLWMGVPVVTYPGATFASRHATSHLSNGGCAEFVATDRAGYVRLAIGWASRLDDLALVRASLRERVRQSPLCDATQFARDFLATIAAAATRRNADHGRRPS
jgi:protein O-GlcNAc transferase